MTSMLLEYLCRQNPMVAYVCEGVYLTGGYSPIKKLRRLQECYGLFIYIDDAHGLSTFGRQGEGFVRFQFPKTLGERTIITASLTNAFGASAEVLMLARATTRRYFDHIPGACSASPM